MATVAELSGPYGNFMIAPRSGPYACSFCFDLTDGRGRCSHCAFEPHWLDGVTPISYSVAGEQLHHALAGYKRLAPPGARRLAIGLAAVLWRHLAGHERCLARAVGVASFELVTTVPSSDRARDAAHPLRELAGALVGPTRGRYERVLRRSDAVAAAHRFTPDKYEPLRPLAGRSVLLIDDTWTTGANAQSAAAALKAAGAGPVGTVVIGRHVRRDWQHNDRLLRTLERPFDWAYCALCDAPGKAG